MSALHNSKVSGSKMEDCRYADMPICRVAYRHIGSQFADMPKLRHRLFWCIKFTTKLVQILKYCICSKFLDRCHRASNLHGSTHLCALSTKLRLFTPSPTIGLQKLLYGKMMVLRCKSAVYRHIGISAAESPIFSILGPDIRVTTRGSARGVHLPCVVREVLLRGRLRRGVRGAQRAYRIGACDALRRNSGDHMYYVGRNAYRQQTADTVLFGHTCSVVLS